MLSINLAVLVLLQLQVADLRLELREFVHQFLIGIWVIIFWWCANHGHVKILLLSKMCKLNIICIWGSFTGNDPSWRHFVSSCRSDSRALGFCHVASLTLWMNILWSLLFPNRLIATLRDIATLVLFLLGPFSVHNLHKFVLKNTRSLADDAHYRLFWWFVRAAVVLVDCAHVGHEELLVLVVHRAHLLAPIIVIRIPRGKMTLELNLILGEARQMKSVKIVILWV